MSNIKYDIAAEALAAGMRREVERELLDIVQKQLQAAVDPIVQAAASELIKAFKPRIAQIERSLRSGELMIQVVLTDPSGSKIIAKDSTSPLPP